MTTAALHCEGVTVHASAAAGPDRCILKGVSAVFAAGRVALVTGDTGAGKTTLLHVLAALRRPAAGQVRYGDDPVSRWTTAHRARYRRRVGIVFQSGFFFEDLDVTENVAVPMVPTGMGGAEIAARCRAVLDRLDLAALARFPVHRLSGGERQRVSIARALAPSPAVILADEPTSHQDDRQTHRVLTLLGGAAREDGAIVVLTAHDPRAAAHPSVNAAYRLTGGLLERRT